MTTLLEVILVFGIVALPLAAWSGARAPKRTLDQRVKQLEELHDDDLYPWKPW